jgi:hypothetical protein
VLARDTARRLHAPRWRWPRWLRTKWMALALFAGVLFAYELFDLWSLPRSTAYVIVGYFAGAIVIDTLFAGASFCKYLCPIGQFNFVASTVSPLHVQIRDASACRSCRTFDCIKGRPATLVPPRRAQRGCELGLFQPLKIGNMDCTFCLDCVQACPYDNVTISARVPGLELADDRRRSGIGRFQARWDLAALAMLFVAAALMNAFAMVAPVRAVETRIAAALGVTTETWPLAIVFFTGCVILPATVLALFPHARRYAYALIPFGLGVWTAHYAFHFLTGVWTIVPVTQRAAVDLTGLAFLGEPWWGWVGLGSGAIFPIQVGFVLLGAIGSCGALFAIRGPVDPLEGRIRTVAPWAVLLLTLFAAALWLIAQPMDMRGTGLG